MDFPYSSVPWTYACLFPVVGFTSATVGTDCTQVHCKSEQQGNPCLLCYSIPPKNPQIKITVSAQFLESAEIHKENEFVRLYWIVICGIIN